MKNLKNDIIALAKDKFHQIPKRFEVVEFNVKIGWLELHFVEANKCSLNDFILSSLRHVEFWKYEKDDKMEFENDIQLGKYRTLKVDETNEKLQLLNNMFSIDLKKLNREQIPNKLDGKEEVKSILIYDEWNNTSLVFASKNQYKSIYFGHSE